MAIYDLPAFIDYIRTTTGVAKIGYVGYSEGTTQMFMALALTQEYIKANVNIVIAQAPIANLGSTTSETFKVISKYHKLIEDAVEILHLYNFFPKNYLTNNAMAAFCKILPEVCGLLLK
jgi:lysosomal acid lipase/cholesteryl ester hydrolase